MAEVSNATDIYTYREIVASFQMAQDLSGSPSDDGLWSSRAIIRHLHQSRATLLYRDLRKNPNITYRRLRQTIGCIPLEMVPVEQCPCAAPSGCFWKRTTVQLPPSIGEYLSVNSVGGDLKKLRAYQYVDWYGYKYTQTSRFQFIQDAAYYTLRDGLIYFIVGEEDREEYVSVVLIPENPLAVFDYPNCEGKRNPCFQPLEQEFLMPPGRKDELLDLTFAQIGKLKSVAVYDKTNDHMPAVTKET